LALSVLITNFVLLANWNDAEVDNNISHRIAGITCNKERYVYNDWTHQTIDTAKVKTFGKEVKIPCELK